MLLIECPFCGPRSETEFRYCGEAHMVRPAPDADEAIWASYLYLRDNARGEHAERWRHIQGCGQFLNAVRDTLSDKIKVTYEAVAARPSTGGEL